VDGKGCNLGALLSKKPHTRFIYRGY